MIDFTYTSSSHQNLHFDLENSMKHEHIDEFERYLLDIELEIAKNWNELTKKNIG